MRRLLLIVAGVVAALALAEGTLQVLRVTLGASHVPDARPTAHQGKTAVLCVGDSHTYGLGVQRELQSYPVRLEVLLNGGRRDGPFVVENLGTPGNNVALARWQLRRALARSHYDLVIALAGYNDEWNATAAPADDAAAPAPRLLLPQLVRWIRFCLAPPSAAADTVQRDEHGLYVVGADGAKQYVNDDAENRPGLHSGAELARRVEAELTALVGECRRAGVPVVLQTYAGRFNGAFEMASAGARVTAQKEHVPLVDQAARFDALVQKQDVRVLFQPDGHPTGAGYEQMAQALAAQLHELVETRTPGFADWPLAPLPGAAPGAAISAAPAAAPVAAEALAVTPEPAAAPGVLRFRLRGPRGAAYRLAFARAEAPAGTAPLRLQPDALFAASLNADGLAGTFDADGNGSAWVAAELFTAPAQAEAVAQLLALDPYAADPQAALRGGSATLRIPWPGPVK